MKIQPVVDSLDAVDTSLREAYTENTETKQYELDFAKYDAIIQRPLLNKRQELLDELKKKKPLLERAEKFKDLDDESYESYQQWKADQESGQGKDKPDPVAKIREEVSKAVDKTNKVWEAKHGEKEAEVTKLTSLLKKNAITGELTRLAIKSNVKEDRLGRFVEVWANRFDVPDLENGKVVYLDENNEVSHLSPEQAIKQVIFEAEAFWFDHNGKGGSGAPSGNTNGGNKARTMKRADWQKLSPAESTKFFANNGTVVD